MISESSGHDIIDTPPRPHPSHFPSSHSDRRTINRKSAQKHRTRRREELETLTSQLAERDARIAQLERDLAVERAKSLQLTEFMTRHVKLSAPCESSRFWLIWVRQALKGIVEECACEQCVFSRR